MFGLPDLGFVNDLMNPFDEPKKTSMSTIASNVFLLLCCTMIATSIWSNPFKFRIPPLFMSLVVACLCVSLAGKNLNDERAIGKRDDKLKPGKPSGKATLLPQGEKFTEPPNHLFSVIAPRLSVTNQRKYVA